MSRSSVAQSFGPAGTTISFDAAERILHDAGRISRDEQEEMQTQVSTHTLDPKAAALFKDAFGEMNQLRRSIDRQNGVVEPEYNGLLAEAKAKLAPGRTLSYGGSPVKDGVKAVMNKAIADGAVVYDVRQLDDDPFYNYDHSDLGPNGLQTTGVYSPYAQEETPVGPLAFDYTELTPEKLEEERTKVQTFNVLDTSQGNGGFTKPNGEGEAILKQVTSRGSARIDNRYDTAFWSDPFARGAGNMKWAGNFAILADGSVHAVPASRRPDGPNQYILTTASLARGKLEVFNGHLFTDESGTVTYVGKSGRLKDFKTVDAVELLKAAGFKTAPGLRVTQE